MADELYDYHKEVRDSLYDFIVGYSDLYEFEDSSGNIIKDKAIDKLTDLAMGSPAVTGRMENSFTNDRETAKQYLDGNMDLLAEACKGAPADKIMEMVQDPEAADVTIRCYLVDQELPNALDDVINDYYVNRTKMKDQAKSDIDSIRIKFQKAKDACHTANNGPQKNTNTRPVADIGGR